MRNSEEWWHEWLNEWGWDENVEKVTGPFGEPRTNQPEYCLVSITECMYPFICVGKEWMYIQKHDGFNYLWGCKENMHVWHEVMKASNLFIWLF